MKYTEHLTQIVSAKVYFITHFISQINFLLSLSRNTLLSRYFPPYMRMHKESSAGILLPSRPCNLSVCTLFSLSLVFLCVSMTPSFIDCLSRGLFLIFSLFSRINELNERSQRLLLRCGKHWWHWHWTQLTWLWQNISSSSSSCCCFIVPLLLLVFLFGLSHTGDQFTVSLLQLTHWQVIYRRLLSLSLCMCSCDTSY